MLVEGGELLHIAREGVELIVFLLPCQGERRLCLSEEEVGDEPAEDKPRGKEGHALQEEEEGKARKNEDDDARSDHAGRELLRLIARGVILAIRAVALRLIEDGFLIFLHDVHKALVVILGAGLKLLHREGRAERLDHQEHIHHVLLMGAEFVRLVLSEDGDDGAFLPFVGGDGDKLQAHELQHGGADTLIHVILVGIVEIEG